MDDFFGAIFAIGIVGIAFYVGTLTNSSSTAFDCKNYGKTQIDAKWYDCTPKAPK